MRLQRGLAILAVVVAVAFPVALAVVILTTSVDVPFWDEWEWADLIYRSHMGTLQFADIWAQHNEHRLLFPQLIVLALDRFGGWSQTREQLVSLFFLVCTEIGLLAIIRRTLRGAVAAVAVIMSCVFLFGLWQNENLSWGFQTAWFICNACVVGVVALLARPDRQSSEVGAAILLGVIASYSSSQGLVAWVAGAVAIVLVPRTVMRTLVVWICAAAATYAIFKIDSVPATAGHINVLQHPTAVVQYMLAYFGSPLENMQGVVKSALCGAFVLTAIAVSFVSDIARPNRLVHLTRRAPWYALAVYPLVCAAGTAYGRGEYGVDQALASRYTSIAGLLWISAVVIGCTYVSRLPALTWRVRIFAVAVSVVAIFAARAEFWGWENWQVFDARSVAARAAFERSDATALTTMYPDPQREKMLINELKRIHAGVFSGG